MGNAFGWPHLLLILAVVLLVFGAAKLPALAKSLGQSARVFKGEMKAMKEDGSDSAETQAPVVENQATPVQQQPVLNPVSDTTQVNGAPKSSGPAA